MGVTLKLRLPITQVLFERHTSAFRTPRKDVISHFTTRATSTHEKRAFIRSYERRSRGVLRWE